MCKRDIYIFNVRYKRKYLKKQWLGHNLKQLYKLSLLIGLLYILFNFVNENLGGTGSNSVWQESYTLVEA